jgi:uncharacterized damage-inducible protein DinB
MAVEYGEEGTFRGARFTAVDLSGARFHSCNIQRVKITDAWLVDVDVSGEIGNFLVNGVDVTDFVNAELEKRYPERAQLRTMKTPDDYRAMWATVERLWAGAVERAEKLSDAQRHEQVGGEWSFVQTLRHLVFAADAWAGSAILHKESPYHPKGLTHTGYENPEALGIDNDATPDFAEVLKMREDRMSMIRGIVDGLTDAELAKTTSRPPAPGYPEEERTVAHCLQVVMTEEIEHYRYATRDLDQLEPRE